MTEREIRLRERIDSLTDERDYLQEQVADLRVRLKRAQSGKADARRWWALWRERALRRAR